MFLHQIFYQGLKARIASWPTLVLGKKRLLFLLWFLFKIFFDRCESHDELLHSPQYCLCHCYSISVLISPQPTCSISCCPCWTSTRSLWGTISTACRFWPTANRTETSTSCSNSTSPTPPARAACWRRSSPTPCSRCCSHLRHTLTNKKQRCHLCCV